MDRRTFDLMVSSAALVVAVVLLVLGGLLLWGSTFVNDQVHDQLAAQNIFFPPEGSRSLEGPQFADVRQFAGDQLTTGEQAETYANDFIAVHLNEIAGGRTYAEVSSALQADPENPTLQAQAEPLFRGTALRGLLLNAFAFSTVGEIAGISAIVSFVGAGVLGILAVFGFIHARRVRRDVAAAPRPLREDVDASPKAA
jgi:hypothetical protein